MKPSVFLPALSAAAALSCTVAEGQVVLNFTGAKEFLQSGPSPLQTVFRRGALDILVRDGGVEKVSCYGLSGLPEWYPAGYDPILCPLGTSGYITRGDANGDGNLDEMGFFSLTNVSPASLIDPYREDECAIVAAPPSKLPRPYSNFKDDSWLVYYNLLTSQIYQFEVTEYNSLREYGAGPFEWERMDKEIVEGQYVFEFPFLDHPGQTFNLAVAHRQLPEGAGPHHRYPQNDFYFNSGVWDENGFYLLDPNLPNHITWQGNDVSNTFQGIDVWRFMVLDTLPLRDPANPFRTLALGNYDQRPAVGAPPRQADDYLPFVLFPPSGVPLQLPSVFTQEFVLAGNFFDPGEQVVLALRLDRILGTSSVAYDTSARIFLAEARFVITYPSYRVTNFPGETVLTGPGDDFDGDGYSNIAEMAMGTDPTDETEFPIDPVAVQNGDGTVSFTYDTAYDVYLRNELIITNTVTGRVYKVNRNSPDWVIESVPETIPGVDGGGDATTHTVTHVTVTSRDTLEAANVTAKISGQQLIVNE
ncbi:hypothetical protein [Haloferula sargassicola]|uniref:Uncharacterized protein n=1 Tax=Haloferula sargassicola TaxID=490096 RepID=A0ABP9UIP1_9BACT